MMDFENEQEVVRELLEECARALDALCIFILDNIGHSEFYRKETKPARDLADRIEAFLDRLTNQEAQ